jgi:hypothetical protein
MLPVFGLSLVFSIVLCVHVVRTNQAWFWLFIILALPWIGGLVYLFAVVLPSLSSGVAARRFSQSAREALDPQRDYREARAACAETPTVHNQMRLAKAAAALGRHDEAERLYGEAAQGVHADDPALKLGRAQSLIELGRHAEALELLNAIEGEEERGGAPAVALARGRACEGLGRLGDAERAYEWAAGRMPGLEGVGRYAAFLARTGRRQEAEEAIGDMDRRIARASPQFRREGRAWRDLAARALEAA